MGLKERFPCTNPIHTCEARYRWYHQAHRLSQYARICLLSANFRKMSYEPNNSEWPRIRFYMSPQLQGYGPYHMEYHKFIPWKISKLVNHPCQVHLWLDKRLKLLFSAILLSFCLRAKIFLQMTAEILHRTFHWQINENRKMRNWQRDL